MNQVDVKLEFIKNLICKIAEIGKSNRVTPPVINAVEPFKTFFDDDGNLKIDELDKTDGSWTRRELIARYLLLNVVLDQGPDIVGVRELLKDVTNILYKQEIRIFHRPLDFFKELNISIDKIINVHESVKKIRADDWAKTNESKSEKYSLFFAQSQRGIVSIKQVLDYGIHRWGVPLSVPYLLEKDSPNSSQPLVEYLENFESAEIMSKKLKDDERYGLGSAIGDKACHLFAKWYVHTFNLISKKENGWSEWSYETPFDSNAGRILFRTGYLLSLAEMDDYSNWKVIQQNAGKSGVNYIRVTNIRGKAATNRISDENFSEKYNKVVIEHLKTRKRVSDHFEIQKIPNAILLDTDYGIGDFDDGLIFIGTNYCINDSNPNCEACPIKEFCKGFKNDRSLITQYTT